jgi:glutathione S-transferase
MEERYRLIGGPGSPYSLKIRALMRYRRLPFDWLIRARVADEVAHVKPPTIPILHTPSIDHYQSDSTPIVDYLEQRHPGARSVFPDDPGMAFLNFMLEDMSDEWATKFMYQQRWLDAADQEFYGHYLGWFREGPGPWDKVEAYGSKMRDRQVSRNALVGVSPENRPVIDRTFKLVMEAFEKLAGSRIGLFGDRPSSADFSFYGQMTPGAHAPGAAPVMREGAPLTFCWLILMDDMSGWEPGPWQDPEQPPSQAVMDFLGLCGEAYLPFFKANAEALQAGDEDVAVNIWGTTYRQRPFRYQGKCYRILRERFAGLDDDARDKILPILDKTDCLQYLI